MKTLGANYWADVGKIEDNLAHLIEHCMIEYLYRQMTKVDKSFFSCDGRTDDNHIALDIEVHDTSAAEYVDKLVVGKKPDIPTEVIGDQLHRIEIEEELPLRYSSLDAVAAEANKTWHGLKWRFGEPKRDSVVAPDKPNNNIIEYGLAVKHYQLRLDYVSDEINMTIADMLAVKFLRDKNIYATSYHPDGKGATYEFKVLAKTSKDFLDGRLKYIRGYYLSDNLLHVAQRNFGLDVKIPEIKFSLTML
jgi:hypothetical protein